MKRSILFHNCTVWRGEGHSLPVAIGASDLPESIPPLPTLLDSLAGAVTIYSDSAHPSSVVIPLVPASALN